MHETPDDCLCLGLFAHNTINNAPLFFVCLFISFDLRKTQIDRSEAQSDELPR